MGLKNTTLKYGLVTKIFHALIALLFVAQFSLVYIRDNVPKDSELSTFLILQHKSIGFTLLFIGLFFVLWGFLNTKPIYPSSMKRWQVLLATSIHHSLYLVILLMPLTGTLMSQLGGRTMLWFGTAVPNIVPVNKAIAGYFYQSHVYLSYIILALVSIHTIGALIHYFYYKDNILQRMWWKS